MALIDSLNKTKLRSLKYGGDMPGGGNSKQPYIESKIPEPFQSPSSKTNLTEIIEKSAIDVKRLSKWLSQPLLNGVLFTAKQNALSRIAVPAQGGTPQAPKLLNEGIYTPLSTLAQAGVVAFGGHLNKQGLNPFTSTGAYAKNPNLYFDKAKTSNLSANNYIRSEQVTTRDNTFTVPLDIADTQFDVPFGNIVFGSSEPLLGERTFSTGTTTITSVDFQNRLANLWYNKIEQKTESTNIIDYTGGPGSILGFGKTNIRFADQRTGINSLKIDWLDGTKTWKPNQEINREFTTLIGKETAKGASKAYATTNKLALDNDAKDGTRVYVSKVGLDAELFNPLATGLVTWTPNQKIDRNIFSNQISILSSYGISGMFSQRNKIPLLSILNTTNFNEGKYVYVSGSAVGLNAKLFNPNATGPVTWTPKITNDNWTIPYPITNTLLKPILSGSGITDPILNSIVSTRTNINIPIPSVYKPGPDQTILNNNDEILYANGSVTYNQTQIISQSVQSKANFGSPSLQDFRTNLLEQTNAEYIMSTAPPYATKNIDSPSYIGMDSAGKRGDKRSYTNGKILKGEQVSKVIDTITSEGISEGMDGTDFKDLCKFNIGFLNAGNKSIQFRAYLDNISDSYSPNWNSFKYPGRADSFYTYEGFDRKLTLGWSIVALSRQELNGMYDKLNYLASATTAEYSQYGYMKGVLIELTIGSYIKKLPGFINSLTYDISTDTTWEIGIDDKGEFNAPQLPHMIKVTMGYTPIPNYLAQYKEEQRSTPRFVYMYDV